MTPNTLAFLLELLDAQQLNVGAPDFELVVAKVMAARRELVEAIESATPRPLQGLGS